MHALIRANCPAQRLAMSPVLQRLVRLLFTVCGIAGLVLALPLPADAARLALVVGKDNYTAVPKLRNARDDA